MITRRGLLTGTIAAGLAGSRVALAQAYPNRPIKAILPYTAGSPNDVIARVIGPVLSARLGDLAGGGVVEADSGRRYRLSGRGRELARVLYELNRWAEQPGVSSRSELA